MTRSVPPTQEKQNKRPLLLGILVALLLVGGSLAFFLVQDNGFAAAENTVLKPAPLPGHPAPAFRLQTLEGQDIDLEDLRGQAVVLNFWATWCGPCRVEMPDLQEAHETYGDDGLVILGVNLTQRDQIDAVPGFLDEFGISYPVVLDRTGEVTDLYKVRGQPASVFIDGEGTVQQVFYGPVNRAFIAERVMELLPS